MTKLRVCSFSISLDGFGAGPNQELANPMGVRGMELHEWAFATKTFKTRVLGQSGGSGGIDEEFAARGFENLGAWILGRNMFGPIRGAWPDEKWKGWWGEEPPYHTPVYVLTHHPRRPIEMKGGTTFYFVTDGIESALSQARKAAKGKDVRLGGGVSTVRQYVSARLVDELHLAVSPTLLSAGENLFSGLDLSKLGYRCVDSVRSEKAAHFILAKQPALG